MCFPVESQQHARPHTKDLRPTRLGVEQHELAQRGEVLRGRAVASGGDKQRRVALQRDTLSVRDGRPARGAWLELGLGLGLGLA